MKIIIATHDTKEEAILNPLADAFRNMGHDVETFYTAYELLGVRISYQLPKKFTNIFLLSYIGNNMIAFARNRLQSRILKKIKNTKLDLFIVIKGKHISTDTINKIRLLGVKTANWFPDGMWNIGTLRRIAPHYDIFFVMDPNCKKVLESEGLKNIYYLPMASFKSGDYSIESVLKNKEYDISFVGILASHYEREEVLGKLRNFNLKIWGTPEWADSSLKDFYQGPARGKEMSEIYRKSKIVVNVHVKNDATQGPNLRSFEAMISGAMVVSDYKEGLAELFKDQEDIVYFRNLEELPVLVKYYLDNESERERIARNGYNKVISEHTMDNRAKTILAALRG